MLCNRGLGAGLAVAPALHMPGTWKEGVYGPGACVGREVHNGIIPHGAPVDMPQEDKLKGLRH